MKFFMSFLLLASACYGQQSAYTDYKILNFDKVLTGTDKMIVVMPPPGKYWLILQGSSALEQPLPGVTFAVWLDNAPFGPYHDPVTGKPTCQRCLSLVMKDASTRTFFPIKGQMMPIVVSFPNRLMIAYTPVHGGFSEPVPTYTSLAIVEHDLPPAP